MLKSAITPFLLWEEDIRIEQENEQVEKECSVVCIYEFKMEQLFLCKGALLLCEIHKERKKIDRAESRCEPCINNIENWSMRQQHRAIESFSLEETF